MHRVIQICYSHPRKTSNVTALHYWGGGGEKWEGISPRETNDSDGRKFLRMKQTNKNCTGKEFLHMH